MAVGCVEGSVEQQGRQDHLSHPAPASRLGGRGQPAEARRDTRPLRAHRSQAGAGGEPVGSGGCVARPGRGASWCQGDACPPPAARRWDGDAALAPSGAKLRPALGAGWLPTTAASWQDFGEKKSSWRPGVPGPVVLPWAGATRGQRCPAHGSAGAASSPGSAGWGFWGAPRLVVLPLPRGSPWGPPLDPGLPPQALIFGAAVVLGSGLGLRNEDP